MRISILKYVIHQIQLCNSTRMIPIVLLFYFFKSIILSIVGDISIDLLDHEQYSALKNMLMLFFCSDIRSSERFFFLLLIAVMRIKITTNCFN